MPLSTMHLFSVSIPYILAATFSQITDVSLCLWLLLLCSHCLIFQFPGQAFLPAFSDLKAISFHSSFHTGMFHPTGSYLYLMCFSFLSVSLLSPILLQCFICLQFYIDSNDFSLFLSLSFSVFLSFHLNIFVAFYNSLLSWFSL